jgi:N-acetyl-anhydromuramyl-L-alanine amidase AmpD
MFDRTLQLSSNQFYPEHSGKSLIALHHTVGGGAGSTFRWWQHEDPRRIGTAFIVDRDGTVFEVFPPTCWAYHLGVKDQEIERRSIGVEIASEGGLKEVYEGGDSHLYAFDGQKYLGRSWELLESGRVVRLDEPWRGYRWFDAYEPAQVDAVCQLVVWLCDEFGIPKRLPEPKDLVGSADLRRWLTYAGVLHHAMLRRDKSDLHPGFAFERLRRELAGSGYHRYQQ